MQCKWKINNFCYSHESSAGKCVKAKISEDLAFWSLDDCASVTSDCFICAKRHKWEYIGIKIELFLISNNNKKSSSFPSAPYVQPTTEYVGDDAVTITGADLKDPEKYCRDQCKSTTKYFTLNHDRTSCYCVPKVPLGG